MGRALYRKYRSKSLDEIVGQEHITTTLKNALVQARVNHAYLFTGPRGTGKTSIARILAHELNKLPYSEDSHFDIIEIDAASNNGVEDVRELREKVQSAPSSAQYKVYIIDEVHMLSKPAFNALLKTLEEPPEHVVFILATTEAHKLPETIISRTQRFSFRPVPLQKVVDHLRTIAKKEKIVIDDEALSLIAEHGEGSFRDSISLLDQASASDGTITAALVEQLLGRAPSDQLNSLLTHLTTKSPDGLAATLHELYAQGYDASIIAAQLSKRLRSELYDGVSPRQPHETIALLQALIEVPASPRPAQQLELILLNHAFSLNSATVIVNAASTVIEPVATALDTTLVQSQVKSTDVITPSPVKSVEDHPKNTTEEDTPETTPPPPNDEPDSPAQYTSTQDVDELWHDVLQTIKQQHNTLYGIARMAKPALEGNTLTLSTRFPFHQKRLNEAKNKGVLATCVSQKRGEQTTIICVVSTGDKTELEKPDVTNISNIFGGAELL